MSGGSSPGRGIAGLGAIAYGGDYNAEQWPEAIWAEDVRLMGEAGVNLVTVGVFSWARIEGSAGRYDFGWLDRLMDLLGDAGISVDLATSTASPPAWLVEAHPEILPVTADGHVLERGSRQHFCPSAPAYRSAATTLVQELAHRYRDHPALVMWHIGNEYGCHVRACFCDGSAASWRRWLEHRYGTIDRLNEAWGTAFWSQRYSDWREVRPPRSAPTFRNPAQLLDWARFSSDELLACFDAEREILKAACPAIPVTTNFVGWSDVVDGWSWAAHLDVTSIDSYPDPSDPESFLHAGMVDDLARSLNGGKGWLLMEQAPSAVNWRRVNVPKAPGQYRTQSLQAVARGGDGVLSFQWRASQSGAEKFHSGMVPHAGTDSRVWREVVALGADLGRLASVLGSDVASSVAVLFDWESWWATQGETLPSAEADLTTTVLDLYRALFRAGLTVDFVRPGAALGGYPLVVVPMLYLVGDGAAAALVDHVAAGATVLVTYFSGIVDPSERVRLGGYPAPWTEMLGLRVEEMAPVPSGISVPLEGPLGRDGGLATVWQDDIHLQGAEARAHYAAGVLRGRAAVTAHRWGAGRAYYLGTRADPGTLRRLVEEVASSAGVSPSATVRVSSGRVERVARGGHLFVINHDHDAADVQLVGPHLDLLSGRTLQGRVTLDAWDALVLVDQLETSAR